MKTEQDFLQLVSIQQELIPYFTTYLNADYLTQVIYHSTLWHNIASINIASINGAGGGGGMMGTFMSEMNGKWYVKMPFRGSVHNWSIAQKKLADLTLKYMILQDKYIYKEGCKSCYTNDLRDTILKQRQHKCHMCGADVNRFSSPDSRIIRYYYSQGDLKFYLDVPEYSCYTMAVWFTERFNQQIEHKKHHKKFADDFRKRGKK